jgi:Mg2+ and Co2+ transporter CorA
MAQIPETKPSTLPQGWDAESRRDIKDELNRLVAAINALEARVTDLEDNA